MSDFRDPELERLLGAGTRGPNSDVDVEAAYDRVRGRVRTVKRRRAAVVGGAACSLLLALGVLAAGRGNDHGSIQPGGDGSRLQPDDTVGTDDTVSSVTIDDSTVTSDPAGTGTTTPIPNTTAADGTSVAGRPVPTNSTTAGTTPSVPTASAPATVASTMPTSSPAISTPTTVAPPASTAAPVTTTFSGIGGSVTVRLQDGTLTLISAQAAEGFGTEVRQASGDRVEVRFESTTHRTDARVDLSNGSMVPRIDESER